MFAKLIGVRPFASSGTRMIHGGFEFRMENVETVFERSVSIESELLSTIGCA